MSARGSTQTCDALVAGVTRGEYTIEELTRAIWKRERLHVTQSCLSYEQRAQLTRSIIASDRRP